MAACHLCQGRSTHLCFILEHRLPPVSRADLGANADEHVAGASSRSRPLLPLVQTLAVILAPTVAVLFRFFFFQDENIFISFLPLICLLSARCQSPHGCSSSEVTLTLTKELSNSNTPAYQCLYVVALRLIYSGCILTLSGFSIWYLKLSGGRKDYK